MAGQDDKTTDRSGESNEPPNDAEATLADAADLLRDIDDEREEVSEQLSTVEDDLARRVSEDRSRIGRIVLWLFAISSGATVVFVIASAFATETRIYHIEWKPAADFLLSFLTSVVLPVVTLVIGFYFGTQKSSS